MSEMEAFVQGLPSGRALRIADVGSKEPSGNYRRLFRDHQWKYFGLDISTGPNVDIVVSDPYEWKNVESESFDVVISGQTAEHTERPWLWMREVARIVRPFGVVCVIAPYQWVYHPESGMDCWRIFPDGMRTIMQDAGLTVLRTYMNDVADTVGIAVKGGSSDLWKIRAAFEV